MDRKRGQGLEPDSIGRFTERVENYVKYRPEYPAALFEYLESGIGLDSSWVVADIGAGTGISSKPFLERGNRVFAVEPNEAMRTASTEALRPYRGFRVIEGTAANTGLGPESVDLVFAGQSFHWFCNPQAVKEFRRILRPGGCCCIVWNERELEADEFHRDLESLITLYATDYERIRHDKISHSAIERVFGASISPVIFNNSQTVDRDGLTGRILSASYMPDQSSPRYRSMLKNIHALFAKHEENGRISVSYKTKLFYAMF